MLPLKKIKFIVWGVLLTLGVVAWILEANLFLNWDVSWDLLATERLLQGGTYTHDFFDLNPPLIFFLYAPAVALSKFFALSLTLTFRLYIFAIAFFSLWICHTLIRRIVSREHALLSDLLLISILFTFLLLPTLDFGEREHLLLVFTLPYFLTVAYRLQHLLLNRWYAVGIGIFSILGFALKPYFMIAFLFVELFAIGYTRQLWYWVRTEVITMAVLLIAYVGVVVMYYPDYLSVVVPLAKRYYYAGFHSPWPIVLENNLVYFCGMASLIYMLQYKNNPYKILCTVLWLAMFGFLSSYLLQQTGWAYHILPATGIAILLLTISSSFLSPPPYITPWLGSVAAILLIIPLLYIDQRYTNGYVFQKNQRVLKTFLQTHAQNQPVYFITASPREIFPTVMDTNAVYTSRFLHFFWTPGFVQENLASHDSLFFPNQITKDENAIIDMISEDIENPKAKFILVDVKKHKSFFRTQSFEYLPYLLQFARFQTAFKPYRYFATIKAPSFPRLEYEFEVYVRTNTPSAGSVS